MTMLSARNGAPAGTSAAYITDEEKKLLMRRDALLGKKKREFTPEGIPVLAPYDASSGLTIDQWMVFGGGKKNQTAADKAMVRELKRQSAQRESGGVSKKVARKETKMADQYAAAKETGKDYKGYVESSKSLKEALRKIQDEPDSKEAKYWGRRIKGDATAESFGVALMGENKALVGNTYTGKPSSATSQAIGRGIWQEGGERGAGFMERNFPTPAGPGDDGGDDGGGRGGGGRGGYGGGDGGYDRDNPTFDEKGLRDAFLDEIVLEGASSEVIERRLRDLISKNNPLFKAASTRALQEMARRGSGLINSSMAEEAVLKAIMEIAMPIVMEDAKNYREQRQLNQGLTNAQITEFNNNYYATFQTKLQSAMDQALQAMVNRAANWRAILGERGRIATTAGMSDDAVRAGMGAVTPSWYSGYGGS